MSNTYHLACPDMKLYPWVGQGWDTMTTFYSGDDYTPRLRRFLLATCGKPLILVSSQSEITGDFQEFEEESDEEYWKRNATMPMPPAGSAGTPETP